MSDGADVIGGTSITITPLVTLDDSIMSDVQISDIQGQILSATSNVMTSSEADQIADQIVANNLKQEQEDMEQEQQESGEYADQTAFVAYLIHKELYGDGMDVLVSLRVALAGIMFLLIVIFFQFIKIKDLQSQRTILRGIFIGWSSLFIVLIILNSNLIHFIIFSGIAALINLISLFSLVDLIKEERNTLTDKEIYLLQKLANKK
jgi:hypothetical protein